jgi:hypothetical protein
LADGRIVVDVRDGGQEAQRADAARVGESRRAADEPKRSDRSAVLAEQIQRLVGAIDIRRGSERCRRVLHLHDDRQNGQRIGLHARPQGGVDLLFRKYLREGPRRRAGKRLREDKDKKRAGDRGEPSTPHALPVRARSLPRSRRSGMLKQNVLP